MRHLISHKTRHALALAIGKHHANEIIDAIDDLTAEVMDSVQLSPTPASPPAAPAVADPAQAPAAPAPAAPAAPADPTATPAPAPAAPAAS